MTSTKQVVIEETTVREYREDDDHEKYKHYVPKDQLDAAWLNGKSCVALCGKKWFPTRDPDKFPLCPRCKEIYEALPLD